jgi:peptide/nickel transport system permease protein
LTELAAPNINPGLGSNASGATAADQLAGITTASISPRRQAFMRFKQHKGAVVSVFLLTFVLIFIILTPITARYGVNEPVFKISEGPNQFLSPRSIAWFGTDSLGRDLYSRLIYGMRVSMLLGLFAGLISVSVGAAVGALAGLRGGLFDDIMMRVTDIFLAFPFLVSLLVTRNFLNQVTWMKRVTGELTSIRFLVILFSIFGWMSVARIVRGQVLALREREFVEASRAIGGGSKQIILRHMLPNSIGPLLVSFSFSIVGAIGGEATLALFGYGPDPGAGSTSLGVLVADSKIAARQGNWWLVVFPFAAFLIITLCISFIGDGMRDATDPKSSQGRAA